MQKLANLIQNLLLLKEIIEVEHCFGVNSVFYFKKLYFFVLYQNLLLFYKHFDENVIKIITIRLKHFFR